MTKIYELSNEMLSEVAGGSGPIIRNPHEYNSACVRTDWLFFCNRKSIKERAVKFLDFYYLIHGHGPVRI